MDLGKGIGNFNFILVYLMGIPSLGTNTVFYLVVVWNLVTIAVERYLAVCQPFKHSSFTKQKVIGAFIFMYAIGIPCTFMAAFDVIFFEIFEIFIVSPNMTQITRIGIL